MKWRIIETEFRVQKVGQTYFSLGLGFSGLIAFSISQVRHAGQLKIPQNGVMLRTGFRGL